MTKNLKKMFHNIWNSKKIPHCVRNDIVCVLKKEIVLLHPYDYNMIGDIIQDKKIRLFRKQSVSVTDKAVKGGSIYFLSDFILKANAIIEAVNITNVKAVQMSIGVSISLKFPTNA